ncbi:MAG: S16 family serine protease [Buchananella hordeovulneris]|nr:S16 family serine protease [Buchananella hordeovulneris]
MQHDQMNSAPGGSGPIVYGSNYGAFTSPTTDASGQPLPAAAPARPRRKRGRGFYALLTAIIAAPLLVAVSSFVRAPYVIESPGLTLDVLGEVSGRPVVSVDGLETFQTSGELRMTTVSMRGGPGHHVTYLEVLGGWLDPDSRVIPEEEIFPQGTTQEQVDAQGAAQMVTSQENAMARALTEIGVRVPAKLAVVAAAQTSDALGKLEENDQLTFISAPGRERVALEYYDTIHSYLSKVEPGTTVTIEYLRDGKPGKVDIVTMAPVNGATGGPLLGASGSRLGIYLTVDMDLPFDVSISVGEVSGPSAGLMFTLALIDKLTPGELTGGKKVAGTGTLGMDATVGPIGGADLKIIGAKRDGAQFFLLPVDNCADVASGTPAGIQVVAVASLSEARQALESISAGDVSSLQTCAQATARLQSQE